MASSKEWPAHYFRIVCGRVVRQSNVASNGITLENCNENPLEKCIKNGWCVWAVGFWDFHSNRIEDDCRIVTSSPTNFNVIAWISMHVITNRSLKWFPNCYGCVCSLVYAMHGGNASGFIWKEMQFEGKNNVQNSDKIPRNSYEIKRQSVSRWRQSVVRLWTYQKKFIRIDLIWLPGVIKHIQI